jgi:phosphodiesterase/alkaline phosphatase D-like protein
MVNLSVKISNPLDIYELEISKNENFSGLNIFILPSNISFIPQLIFNVARFSIDNLDSDTRYYVRIVDSQKIPIDDYVGSFRTPKVGAHNFKFGFASCSWSDNNNASNQQIYDNIANKAINDELDFFIHLGDMHYRDIDINDSRLFNKAYDDVFKAPRQNNCWKNLPLYYMWDDHDYGPDDTDKYNPSRSAAIVSYRNRVPYTSLCAKNDPFESPYFSFVRGRARFIFTDIRSEREPKGSFPSTSPLQQVFSTDQKQWFFNEMLEAKNNRELIVWVNTKPWISSVGNGKDDWGGYHAARLEIVNFIDENSLNDRIVIIAGDMHALAYDNGSSINNFGNLKVCHAAALDQQARLKGGPYTIGPITEDAGTGWVTQYGILEINDNNSEIINCVFKGIVVNKNNYTENIAINVNFSLYVGNPI